MAETLLIAALSLNSNINSEYFAICIKKKTNMAGLVHLMLVLDEGREQ